MAAACPGTLAQSWPRFGLLMAVCMQEIQDLQSVAVPEHIGTNRTAQAARAARYPITLSTYSFQLLMAFLQGAKLWLLLAIVNQHLKVQVCATCKALPCALLKAGICSSLIGSAICSLNLVNKATRAYGLYIWLML